MRGKKDGDGRVIGGDVRRAVAACSLLLAGTAVAEDLSYVVKGNAVVFTNLPERHARPVPGLAPSPTSGVATRLPPTLYDPFIERVAREQGVSPDLIKAVALVESGLNPHAVSSAGAQGLMQLMPATARQYGVEDPFDPLQSLRAGTLHLRRLLDEFDGDLSLALAAYNAGPGAVRRHGGVPGYPETQEYVRRVHEKMGQEAVQVDRAPPPATREVKLERRADGTFVLSN